MLENLIMTIESQIAYFRKRGDKDKVKKLKSQLKKIKSEKF